MARYGSASHESVQRAVHEQKHGTLRSGRSGAKVKSRAQAIAIGLSEARKKGAKVPPKRASGPSRTSSRSSTSRTSSSRSTSRSRTRRSRSN